MAAYKDYVPKHIRSVDDYILYRHGSIVRFSSLEGIKNTLQEYNLDFNSCEIYFVGGHLFFEC